MVKNEFLEYVANNFYKVSDCYWVSWDKRDCGIYCWEGVRIKSALAGVSVLEKTADNKSYERIASKAGYKLTYRKDKEGIVVKRRLDGKLIATWVILEVNNFGDRVIRVSKKGYCLADESAVLG